MATRNNIRGFRPVRHINGTLNPSPHLRTTINNGTSGNNAAPIFPGDVVFINASGALQRYHDAASGGDSRLPIGVVAQVFNSNKRPFTFNAPGAGAFIPASTRGYAAVYEDPGIIYSASTSATARNDDVGQFLAIRVCAANTAAGRSGMGVDLSDAATAAGQVVKMVGISPLDSLLDDPIVSGAANQEVEVMLVNTLWTNPWLSRVVGAFDVSGATT